ncbi:MAG: hypothetical protein GY696_02900, partial [Gammaproteobacteria bacterium]|nr:hypothetical protein [Gammaproteobacteria bacterium]
MPQGSVIGSTLFLAFIDGLTGLVLSPSTQCFLYADDLLLLTSPLLVPKMRLICTLISVRLAIIFSLSVSKLTSLK